MNDHTHTWETLVSQLNTWKRGSQLAPHKPLLTLLLLARARAGNPNTLSFEEVNVPLTQLLREFGPPRKSHHPEFPFWYLQNDGFWHVHDRAEFEHPLRTRKGKSQPTRRSLLHHHAVGEVPQLLWKQLQVTPGLIDRLATQLLDQFWPQSVHNDILQAVGLDLATETVTRRKRDPNFRHQVLRAYERKCAVCGYDARLGDTLFGLEAAHIKWHQYQGPDVVPNGLALCSLHHKAFDLGAITLTQDHHILVSQDVVGHDTTEATIISFSHARMRRPQSSADKPAGQFINWHHKNRFRWPEREG